MSTSYPTSVWDGKSLTRPDPNVRRAPDRDDYDRLKRELIAIHRQLQVLHIGADGALRTSPGAGVDEVQSLAAIASTSGNWTLTITVPGSPAFTTASLAFNASAATIESAIDAAATAASVAGWTNGDISVSGGAINVSAVTITYDGTSVAKQNIVQCSTADVDLNDATPPVASTTTGGVAPTASPTTTLYNDSGTLKVG